jgi:hypothetical protein
VNVTNKNLDKFIGFLLIFCVMGTLAWELFQTVMGFAGFSIDLTAGPVGFDIEVLSLYIKLNPGTLIGAAIGYLLFKRL